MDDKSSPAEDVCFGRCCLRPGFYGSDTCRKGGDLRVHQSQQRILVSCSAGCAMWFHHGECFRAAQDLLRAQDPGWKMVRRGDLG